MVYQYVIEVVRDKPSLFGDLIDVFYVLAESEQQAMDYVKGRCKGRSYNLIRFSEVKLPNELLANGTLLL